MLNRLTFLIAMSSLVLTTLGQKKYSYTSVPGDPIGVRIYHLENGLTVYLSANHDEPRIQTNIAVRAGSKYDPSDATGLAHYLEHMLFKGTSKIATTDWEKEKPLLQKISDLYELRRKTKDPVQRKAIYHKIDSISSIAARIAIPNEYDKMTASIGAKGTNAYTSTERTVYVNDIPSTEMEKWMALESERFQELVLRLFHTELEAVYEEYNRGRDNDYVKASEKLDQLMFRKHPYGTQTTIGTSEDLKNPSMVKIHQYFDTYYVPNNMAIVMAGDLDYDKTIAMIDKYFGTWKPKEVPGFTFEKEDEIKEPVKATVKGPMAEWIQMGWRLPGYDAKTEALMSLVSGILSNGEAGLIDINLIQEQKVLNAGCYAYASQDYAQFMMSGNPKAGQKLEDVEQLLLEQLEKLRTGDFDDWLIQAVINDEKQSETRYWNERNNLRAAQMTSGFILNKDWNDVVNRFKTMETFTKQDVINFCNRYLQKDNYVIVYKRNGVDSNAVKVEKPEITPLDVNRDVQSTWRQNWDKIPSERLQPVFLDYKNDITFSTLNNNIPFAYIKNKSNDLFDLYLILDMGSRNDKMMSLAVNYLPYLGTSKYSAEEITKAFFKLGVSYGVNVSTDRVSVYLRGLEENLPAGLALLEELLSDVQPDEAALQGLIKDIRKERLNSLKNKWSILYNGMYSYARYGAKGPLQDALTMKELEAIKPDDLINRIKSIKNFKHRIFYYGSLESEKVMDIINQKHQVPGTLKPFPEKKEYEELPTAENTVYFVNYDMVQTEMMFISRDERFNKDLMPTASLFNKYFGAGLSSIVFQEIREAKALAYSAYAAYTTPSRLNEHHYLRAYVGTQADKLNNAIDALLELLNEMPESKEQFEAARLAAMKQIETSRITKASVYWNYESAKKRGLDYDIRKDIYESLDKLSMKDLSDFFNQHIKGNKYSYLVIGKKENLDFDQLKRLGPVKELSFMDIFGYDEKSLSDN